MKAAIACFLTVEHVVSWHFVGPSRASGCPGAATVAGRSRQGTFTLTADTKILVNEGSADVAKVGKQLAERINRSTGLNLAVSPADGPGAVCNAIC